MSGSIFEDGSLNLTQRYLQRFNELIQVNTTDRRLGELEAEGQYFNNRGQHANATINTQQYYRQISNQGSGNVPQKFFMGASSTCTGASDASIFKKPLPVKKISCRPHTQRKFTLLTELLCSLDDKQSIKFAMTAIETLVHSLKNPPTQPVNPVFLMDYVSSLVKEEYLSKQVPKSICGSSIMSDQASNIDQFSEPRVTLQDITQSSSYRGQYNRFPQNLHRSECSSIDGRSGLLPTHQRDTSTVSVAPNKRAMLPPDQIMETLSEAENVFDLFNDSILAQMRDKAAAGQASTSFRKVLPKKTDNMLPKSTPKPSSKVKRVTKSSATMSKKPANQPSMSFAPVSEKSNLDHTNKNISLLNGTTTGVSRCGRVRKAPVKYWNSKGEELSFREPDDESIFNESMTLRNRKVIGKKETPPQGSKNTPLMTISQNETDKSSMKKPRGRPGRKSLSSEKENSDSGKKKTVKKQTYTAVNKNTAAKGKTNKTREVLKQNKEQTEKKPAPKRKSKESSAGVANKKKKTEDPVENELSDDDDLFGVVNYKKPTYQALKVAISPSAGLLSAKKAAEAAQGKATPPCKTIGDIMMNESIQSAMSAAKEAPKRNDAIKRMIKKMQKNTGEPAKTQMKKTGKEDSNLMGEKSTFSVNNPMCSATLTVFRGTELESDYSDMERDSDDEDDDLM